jgi:hypothetical protein
MISVAFCSDPLNPRRVDEHFQGEADAVRAIGGQVALIDHDAALRGAVSEAIRRIPSDAGSVWYRGWMMPSATYADLADALARRGVRMCTTPDAYAVAHELPGWYPTFASVTPLSVWLPVVPNEPPAVAALAKLVAPLGPGAAIVKDFVKSRKHEWNTACYVPDLTDVGQLHGVVTRMIELQDDSLTGGVVVRRFEAFTPKLGEPAELRVWWLDGVPALLTPHPDSAGAVPTVDLDEIGRAVSTLPARFVTTDLARSTGGWRVVEVGDGQVSDLHAGMDPVELWEALVAART